MLWRGRLGRYHEQPREKEKVDAGSLIADHLIVARTERPSR
jgi:hypothetical protein